MTKSVVLVTGRDWQGLYINEKLCTEGHCVTAWDALNELTEAGLLSARNIEVDENWMEEQGSLPFDLSKIKSI